MELVDIHISMGTVRGVIAALTMATFLGIVWWAYRPGNRGRFEEDALMAFEDDEREALRKRKEMQGGEER